MHSPSAYRSVEIAEGRRAVPPSRNVRATPTPASEAARDFGQLLSEAVEEALIALGHRSPEQYLQLSAARKREALRTKRRTLRWRAADDSKDALSCRNENIVQELGSHLAFEIVHAVQRYARFLTTVGEYSDQSGSATSLQAGRR